MGRIDGGAIFATIATAALWWYSTSVYSRMMSIDHAVDETFSVGKLESGKDFAFDNEDTKKRFIRLANHLLKPHKGFFEQYEHASMPTKMIKGLNYTMNRTPPHLKGFVHGLAEEVNISDFDDRDRLNAKELDAAEARPQKFAKYVAGQMSATASYRWEPRITDGNYLQWEGNTLGYRFQTANDATSFIKIVNGVIRLHRANGNDVTATPAVVEQIGRITDTDNDGRLGERELKEVEARISLYHNPSQSPLPKEKETAQLDRAF